MIIAIITFGVCVIGAKIENKFGDKHERKIKVVGGLILIIRGLKKLLEHTGII